jgi:hypothetical protein
LLGSVLSVLVRFVEDRVLAWPSRSAAHRAVPACRRDPPLVVDRTLPASDNEREPFVSSGYDDVDDAAYRVLVTDLGDRDRTRNDCLPDNSGGWR